MKSCIFFIAVFVSLSFTIDKNPCLTDVRAVFDKMTEVTYSGKICYLSYRIQAVLSERDKQGKDIVSSSSVEMWTTNKQSWYKSEQMEVYRDQVNTITVLPGKKTIYLADAVTGKKDEKLYDKLKQLQDTIFKYADKVECVDVADQKYNKIVTLHFYEKISKKLDMKKVVYYINSTEKTLQRVFIEYVPSKQYKSVDYAFTKSDYDSKEAGLLKPVSEIFFAKENVLKQPYSAFKLVDNRKETYNK